LYYYTLKQNQKYIHCILYCLYIKIYILLLCYFDLRIYIFYIFLYIFTPSCMYFYIALGNRVSELFICLIFFFFFFFLPLDSFFLYLYKKWYNLLQISIKKNNQNVFLDKILFYELMTKNCNNNKIYWKIFW
jgi:hypothetical protein